MTEEEERAVDARIVAEALDWAFRQGYYQGDKAAEAFARMEGLTLRRESLGTYGEKLTFSRA